MGYNNNFTLDGKVRPGIGVTPAKVKRVKELIESALSGDRSAKGMFEEAFTTSDAMFNYKHLTQLNFLPQFEEAPREWEKIAVVRKVSDFRDIIDYELDPQWDTNTLGAGDPYFTAPEIPEGTPYPEAYFTGREAQGERLRKYGFGTGFTFEAFINDSLGVISDMPNKMLEVALDTEESFVFGALVGSGTSANALGAGTNPDGTSVAANAPFTRDALIQALIQVKQRKYNGRYLSFRGGFNLVVAPGAKVNAEFQIYGMLLNKITKADGREYSAADAQLVSGVSNIIESPFVSGNAWYLVPDKGSLGAGRNTLELLRLIGHEAPELRIEDVTGSYVGGSSVSPFEGSFDTDQGRFRLRMFGPGRNAFPSAIIWSSGEGSGGGGGEGSGGGGGTPSVPTWPFTGKSWATPWLKAELQAAGYYLEIADTGQTVQQWQTAIETLADANGDAPSSGDDIDRLLAYAAVKDVAILEADKANKTNILAAINA